MRIGNEKLVVREYEKKPLPSNGTTIGPTKFATFSGQTCFY